MVPQMLAQRFATPTSPTSRIQTPAKDPPKVVGAEGVYTTISCWHALEAFGAPLLCSTGPLLQHINVQLIAGGLCGGSKVGSVFTLICGMALACENCVTVVDAFSKLFLRPGKQKQRLPTTQLNVVLPHSWMCSHRCRLQKTRSTWFDNYLKIDILKPQERCCYCTYACY